MSSERIPLQDFNAHFSSLTELSSVALGGRIVAVSDEFFAEAYHLLEVEPAPSMKGQFGPNGALFSGWETRRHNPAYDWCIIQLGTSGSINGFDVDTANFNGNEAPAVSIYTLHDSDVKDPTHDDARWVEVLSRVDLGPNSRHLFKIAQTPCVNYVKIHMYPDGGIARFRTYGHVIPIHPPAQIPFDLAHVFAGGRVLRVSDQHFGIGSNLILPGRGKNMGDGWETKRSRTKGHHDWVIIQLCFGELVEVEIDTNHFLGNFPESCEIHALCANENLDWDSELPDASKWTLILPRTKLGPHRQHYFEFENVENKTYTHIKITIHPDGGLKRIRVIGLKVDPAQGSSTNDIVPSSPASIHQSQIITIPVLPITLEAFAPFGQVIQAYANLTADATTGISIYRCQALEDISDGVTVLKTLERHPFTSQAFIPMGRGNGEGLADPSDSYLVVVAQNGSDDKPDLKSLKAFVATSAQGISYNAGIWRKCLPLDFACVETQVGDGSTMDCEILDLDPSCTYILKIDP
ncbi:galactose-binding domain-like protein [Flammula alnicola]|nr:galactose-binding domain-like protein [Flammula alnicola]